jgi:hypothetical protein
MYGATTNQACAVRGNPTAKCKRQAQCLSHNFSKHQDSLHIQLTQSNQSNMLLSKFVLPFLAIALSSLAKAASSELIQEELLVTCEGTPGIMGSAEMVFFGSTFVNIHNSANHINNDVILSQVINNDDDGIVLNNATVIGQETHIETVRANLRANFPPNVESGWGTE